MEQEFILYRYFNAQDRLLYVGISVHVLVRMTQHKAAANWWQQAVKVTFERFESAEDLYAAETHAIYTENPLHNISGVSTGRARARPATAKPKRSAVFKAEAVEVNRVLGYLSAEVRESAKQDMIHIAAQGSEVSPRDRWSRMKDTFEGMYAVAVVACRNAGGEPDETIEAAVAHWDDAP